MTQGDNHEGEPDSFVFFENDATLAPSTIEEYGAQEEIIHGPVAGYRRPRYYFNPDNRFPNLPQQGIRESIKWQRLRHAKNKEESKLIEKVLKEIMGATLDGQLSPETVFLGSESAAYQQVIAHESTEDQAGVAQETESLGGFPSKKVLRIAAVCLAAGALVPVALFPAAAAASSTVKSFEAGFGTHPRP